MPKVYEIVMAIEPGIIGTTSSGQFVYLDSADNICRKIGEGIYNRRIAKLLNTDPLKTGFKFGASAKKTSLVKVSSDWKEKDVELGLKAAGQLAVLLAADYKNVVEQKKTSYDSQIFMKQNKINKIETDKNLQQANLKNIRQRKRELTQEIKGVKENTEKIVQQRDLLLKAKKVGDDISLLLYSTTIQQNAAYFNQLSNQVYDLIERGKQTEAKIKKLDKDVDDINVQINDLTEKKKVVSNVRVVQEPEISLYPVKPNKKRNVLLASVGGLFLFTFLAFFIEYLKNADRTSGGRTF